MKIRNFFGRFRAEHCVPQVFRMFRAWRCIVLTLSITMANRLKSARLAAGLSYEKLSAQIYDIYGVKISSDSLMNYEIGAENHRNAYKNQGMRVEYLRCLAGFYKVSSDYLLGLSDIPNPDTGAAREYYLNAAEKEKRLSNLAELLNNVSEEIKEVLNAT